MRGVHSKHHATGTVNQDGYQQPACMSVGHDACIVHDTKFRLCLLQRTGEFRLLAAGRVQFQHTMTMCAGYSIYKIICTTYCCTLILYTIIKSDVNMQYLYCIQR